MLCIYREETDPFFCLAAEEYLLKKYTDDIFMLWQSYDTVVVGKHQNTMAEINYRFIRENGIKVARRISGGGTVFHDFGNVNFSFIKNVQSPHEISFKNFTESIISALLELGIIAVTSGRNDLLVNGKKISGNAEHIFKNRVLHHGTLLFNSNLNHLADAIRVIPGKYAGKAIHSSRSEVTNISDFLTLPVTRDEFIHHLLNHQIRQTRDNFLFSIPEPDLEGIRLLSAQKYKTWDWQYGYSPEYTFTNSVKFDNNQLIMNLTVKKGKIVSAKINGTYYLQDKALKLENILVNKPHCFESISEVHENLNIAPNKELIYSYF
jgi:lipoate---protein ligase